MRLATLWTLDYAPWWLAQSEQVLPLLLPNPQVAGICLWIPASSLPLSGKDVPSDRHQAQTLLPSSLVKILGIRLTPKVSAVLLCGCSPCPFLYPLVFSIKHICFGQATQIISNFQWKWQRKKCLHFKSDITLPSSAAVDTANTKPIFLQQSWWQQKPTPEAVFFHPCYLYPHHTCMSWRDYTSSNKPTATFSASR